MSLINCPECGTRTSEFAAACPMCGFPAPGGREKVQTIEKTSKVIKANILFGIALIIAAFILDNLGIHFLFFRSLWSTVSIGATWIAVTFALRWWRHG